MKKKHLIYAAVIALMIGGIGPVMADSHGGHKGKDKGAMFEKVDVNSDGVITKAEFMDQAEKRYAKMSADGKAGAKTNAEFISQAEARFAKMDADGNGSFTKAEAEAKHAEKKAERKAKRKAKRNAQ